MGKDSRRDVARQVMGVAGAVFQALAGVFFVVSLSSEPGLDEKGATLIDPCGVRLYRLGANFSLEPGVCCLPGVAFQEGVTLC